MGTLSGTICDQFGKESSKIMIEEVSYLPNGRFNLFSLMHMTCMGGNNESIWIEKGHNKIVFDRTMIPMKKGMLLLAMNFTRDTKCTNETTSLKEEEGRKNVGFESGEG
jgi:hypothetical protein